MQAWEEFLDQLEKELGSTVIEKWLRPLKVLRFDAANLYLEAKDCFQVLWFEEHVRPKARAIFVNNNSRPIKVHLSIANSESTPILPKKIRGKKGEVSRLPPQPTFSLRFDSLDPLSTLDQYLVKGANQVPFQLLCELSRKEQLGTFNPLYFYGHSGTGKTHLLMGITQALREQGLNVIYTRADTFTEHVIGAIRAGEMRTFRYTYRNMDALCIDDVHLFSRKGATQEELFHTFNTLHLAGKQIILSANCAPKELQSIEPRLVSRFEWGITFPLEPFSQEDLGPLLEKKSLALQFPLSKKISEFLLESFTNSPKTLIKALETLMMLSHLDENASSKVMSVSLVKEYLADLLEEEKNNKLTPEKVIKIVAKHYSVQPEDILGPSQNRICVLPRQVSMYICRTKIKMPFAEIGNLFSRDHSTVMTSVKRIKESVDLGEQEIFSSITTISNQLFLNTITI